MCGIEIAFTNSALFMLIGLLLILLLMLGATSSRALVPGRLQSVAEMSYEFVATTLQSTAGTEGMKFFPLVFSLFMFILVLNVIGIIPYTFTVTSHIIITVALALLVFFTVVIYGFWKHGLHFFKLWVPAGVPIYIMPLVTFIEVLSFLSRPVRSGPGESGSPMSQVLLRCYDLPPRISGRLFASLPGSTRSSSLRVRSLRSR